jgi:hypothetical protein
MRAMITGGTGFIGRKLVRALIARGDEAVVVSRRASGGARPSEMEPAAELVGWDGIDRELARTDAVFHLAGEPISDARWTPERLSQLRTSRIGTTQTLAGAIGRATRRPRVWVSASAVGIYGMLGADALPTSEDGPVGDDVLARMCIDWESAADPARAMGVRVVHPRVGIVLGAGGGVFGKMVPAFRWGVGGPVGDGRQWVSWIHERDAVRALLLLADRSDLAGPVNLVAPTPVTMAELARALGRAMHRPAALAVPAFALRAVFGEGLARVLLTGQRAVPTALLRAGFAFEHPGIDEALRQLASELR